MEKIVVIKDDTIIDELTLGAKMITIGRDGDSSITLDDPAVSRHHARLVKVYTEYFIEDLNSTNGTKLNDRPVTKHMIKMGDQMTIGDFILRFEQGEQREVKEEELDRTVVIRPKPATPPPERGVGETPRRQLIPKTATVRYFKGPQKGSSEKVDRSLYTIGKPGGSVAVIARRPQGFFLLHIGGDSYPKINKQEISSTRGVQLKEGDVVEVGENLMEISFG